VNPSWGGQRCAGARIVILHFSWSVMLHAAAVTRTDRVKSKTLRIKKKLDIDQQQDEENMLLRGGEAGSIS
jgi:hypothetical protein